MGLKKKVTTKDIADHVGLSQSAVSMILNNKTNVSFSDSTRQKVLDAAKELGYQKKKKSIEQTSKPLSKVILIMCPFLSNHYYTTLVHSITERAHDYGYLTFVAPTLRNPSTEQYYLDLMKNNIVLLESFICIQLLFFQKLMICQNRFQSSISGIKMTRSLLTRSMSAAPNLPDSSQNI